MKIEDIGGNIFKKVRFKEPHFFLIESIFFITKMKILSTTKRVPIIKKPEIIDSMCRMT